ncbi:MAG: ABC transporter permease subunit [Nitrososphaeria archaeon]
MKLRHVTAILRKEFVDAIRDRRTLISMVIFPVILMPILMFLPMYMGSPQANPAQVAIIQMDRSSDTFVEMLTNRSELTVTFLTPTQNLTKMVEDGAYELGLILPKDFTGKLAPANGSLTLPAIYDPSSIRSSQAFSLVTGVSAAYTRSIVARRLEEKGLTEETLNPIRFEEISIARIPGGFNLIVMFLPMMLGMYSAIGAMYFVIDTTAGEKERRTLEVLLTMPSTRSEIVLGKFMVAVGLSVVASALSMAGFAVSAQAMQGAFPQAAALSLSSTTVAVIGVVMLILSMTMAALEMMVCVFARSFKEGQSYLTPITMAAVFLAVFLPWLGESAIRPLIAAPYMNGIVVMRNAMLNKLTPQDLLIGVGTAAVYMVVMLAVAVKVFQSEKVLFRY